MNEYDKELKETVLNFMGMITVNIMGKNQQLQYDILRALAKEIEHKAETMFN